MPSAAVVRAVIDTNVLVSGLFWRGAPHTLIEHIHAGSLTFVSSPELLAELIDVLCRPKFQSVAARTNIDPTRTFSELLRLAEVLDPPRPAVAVNRDPDDDAVLALAVAAQADMVVSGDADLLILKTVAGIPILDPAAALAAISTSGEAAPS